MSDGRILVDPATIHNAADHCKSAGGEIQSQFETLEHQLKKLIDGWTGDAMDQWHARQQEWNKALEDMNSLLARIAIALPEIADGYQQTDTDVMKMFGG
ncbi:WXG100 family type VII secretion target [Amycolatopsis bartoniae]|uniref:ESAT-6-like protein n=1 Tax=Amycolatopsis bartoniae TaxID=941986 RepID=A0A8H9J0P6_9PSEU|nr:WXG100 family type VII secretion target [Amycolatopsis bartoniae]MBB2933883.1 WXG100 family type VII secretion target [Amycolatopsis bartoniae]TVS99259.1 WXG100 family type VII secretion target [Amycolatopsis bartoniae]GHF88364.1 ESAT-6-like protein [Amycolatopsis bartoniae]